MRSDGFAFERTCEREDVGAGVGHREVIGPEGYPALDEGLAGLRAHKTSARHVMSEGLAAFTLKHVAFFLIHSGCPNG